MLDNRITSKYTYISCNQSEEQMRTLRKDVKRKIKRVSLDEEHVMSNRIELFESL